MSDKRSEFIEKYEKSLATALKMEKVMVKYFDQMYSEYLYDIKVDHKPTFYVSGVNYSGKKIVFSFCFDEGVNYSKVRQVRSEIWQGFEDMFGFKLGMWGCPIDVEFYQLERKRL